MRLLTFGSDPSKVRYLKSNFVNIGFNHTFLDLFSKLDAFKKWFENANPDPDEVIIFVDGYDVVQRRTDLDNFENEFMKFGVDIVFSAETVCWPSAWMAHLFPPSPTRYRWPNSGTFVGRAWAIKKMIEFDAYRLAYDDQGYIHDFFIRGADMCKMALDYNQVLFQTGTGVEWSELDNTQAWFVHFNGKSHLTKTNESILDIYARGEPIGGHMRLHGL